MKLASGARILVIGAARQGLALARYLSHQDVTVILNDKNPAEKLTAAMQALEGLPIEWVTGAHPLDLLDRVDCVCVSGGVSLNLSIITEAVRRGIPLTNDSQIFMELVPCPVIGITGSAGKTTTTSLVGRMARAAREGVGSSSRAWVGGNIGLPLIDHIAEIRPSDLVVLELSSFQLELMTLSPQVAALLNITPNHLDRHGSMQAYTAAKARILDFQTPANVAILGREDPGAWALAPRVQGRLVSFGVQRPAPGAPGQAGTFADHGDFYFTDGASETRLFSESVNLLRGDHNRLNVLAACAIALAAGIPLDALPKGVDGFQGVSHRLELVREWNGSRWYNGSISTAPERTIADIHAFTEPIVLMLGGRDKDLPWEDLAALIHQRVDHVVVFGEASEKIMRAIGPVQPGQRPYTLSHCSGVQTAVQAAAAVASPGSVVLFSPGGTSFDEFKDFEERGERFTQWVKAIL